MAPQVSRTVVEHSGVVMFYDREHDLGVDVYRGQIDIVVSGSSELRQMSPARAERLLDLLRLALGEVRRGD